MIRKLKQREKKQLVVGSGTIVGLYMILVLNNPRGVILLLISVLFFLFMKNGKKN